MNRKLTVTAEIEISGDPVGEFGGGAAQEVPQIVLMPHPLSSATYGEEAMGSSQPLGDDIELPGAITILARLPGKTVLDETGLAQAFGVSTATVKRMVTRNELPPPIRVSGRARWIVERIFAHWDELAEKAEKERKKDLARFEKLRP